MAAAPPIESRVGLASELIDIYPVKRRKQLNKPLLSLTALLLTFMLMSGCLNGMVNDNSNGDETFNGEWWETPLSLRHTMDLPMDTMRAQ